MNFENIIFPLLFSPLLIGIIQRTKALFAGRKGQPFFQLYYDLLKLFQKGSVYSQTTTFIFRLSPLIGFSVILIILLLLPMGTASALISFHGDIFLFIYLLGLLRFFYVLAALDTGSSFEGMGASREIQFSIFSELALMMGLVNLCMYFGTFSLSDILLSLSFSTWKEMGIVLGLIVSAFFVVFLTENCRIPIDDPATHLELTMIHEVMVLDHSGIEFGIILYTAALKLWVFGAILVKFIPIHTDSFWLNQCLFVGFMAALAIITGIIESIMARLKLLYVPQLLIGAATLSLLAFFLLLKG